jgi:hypothetical protein
MNMNEATHRDLCKIAAKYLKTHGITPFQRATYAVCELERQGESPDAFGFGYHTQLIEVKVSRSDFLADKKKFWRQNPKEGLGNFRSYLCPAGLIMKEELPDNWGLLYYENNKVVVIKRPEWQVSAHESEIHLITNILRREGIKPQVFSYKKYLK